jgi:hypothetical protein
LRGASSANVGNELTLEDGNMVFQQELASFQTLELYLIQDGVIG